jgi:hypothetical protein
MLKHSPTKISHEHVNHIVKSILNKKQRNIIEQQQTFIRRNTDEDNKRNNYLVDKFTKKKEKEGSVKKSSSSKENINLPITKKHFNDDEDDDFISTKKRPKIITPNPVKECLDSIISQIENEEATCPICNQIFSNLNTIDQRQEHVNRCLEKSQINNVDQNRIRL